MNTSTYRNLRGFSDWIRAFDHHAAHHLKLAGQSDQILSGELSATTVERTIVSEKLERWRYQHFNERARTFSTQDVSFVDSLDLAANALAGRDRRPPRRAWDAVRAAGPTSERLKKATQLLEGEHQQHDLVERATELTNRRFGLNSSPEDSAPVIRRMLMYAPLYISNECVNHCTYCGFRHPLDIARQHLSVDQALAEAGVLRQRGFQHVVVVAGDFPSRTTTEYFCSLIRPLVQMGIRPAIEIAPQNTQSYALLAASGATGLTLYHETYDEQLYRKYHVRGPKSSYHWRLEGHDRAAEAGIKRLGLGVLLGLAPPVEDLQALIRHGEYLSQRFPECTLAFSLPRIHEAPSDFAAAFAISDKALIRFYCILRLVFPQAELVLSTRESVNLRNQLARICITQMSAGSSTSPGGYQNDDRESGKQFPVADQRPPAEVARWLQTHRLQPTWSIG